MDDLLENKSDYKVTKQAPVIGETLINSKGYVMVMTSYGLIGRHRLAMQEYLGRQLARGEAVHHKNGDRQDNRIENLELVDLAEHRQEHHELLKQHRAESKAKYKETGVKPTKKITSI